MRAMRAVTNKGAGQQEDGVEIPSLTSPDIDEKEEGLVIYKGKRKADKGVLGGP